MNYLLDTHILLWSSTADEKLPKKAAKIIADPANSLWVSVVSLWEVAIKRTQNKQNFQYEVAPLRSGLLGNGYMELGMEGQHVLAFSKLPVLHSDPFDRLLVAQCVSEGFTFLTADRQLAQYGERVLYIG